jgi:agmatine deiminase
VAAFPLDSTPLADGFMMPAEFSAHERCYLVWPERTDTWRDGAKPAQLAFAQVASAIALSEPVTVLASVRQWEHARASLPDAVTVVEMTTDDAWARDTGPSFVVDEARTERRGVDWQFNAWGGLDGGLFFPWANDDRVAAKVCELERAQRYRAPIVLEGGAIHVDGEGTCITTEECLLNPNRNGARGRDEVEAQLRAYLGVEVVIWLPRGLPGDETSGHVDNLACFAAPGRVLLDWCAVPGDERTTVTAEARRILESARDARGRALEVVPLPSPSPPPTTAVEAAGVDRSLTAKPRPSGVRLTASYVNSFIANSVVVHPTIDEHCDDEAAAILAASFPGRRIEGVAAREILLGGGGIHCITQQVPVLANPVVASIV